MSNGSKRNTNHHTIEDIEHGKENLNESIEIDSGNNLGSKR